VKTAGEIARDAGGTVVAGTADAKVTSWAFDSRVLDPGACFVALAGERDGREFVRPALAGGASAALVSAPAPDLAVPPGAAVVEVADALRGLQRVAAADRVARSDLRVVAVAGSTGKTSTKDLLAAVLAPLGCYASPASYNNEFGLPITLLNTPAISKAVVAEMGERYPGDIKALCDIARPEIGVVTNVGLAHAEYLGGAAGAAEVIGELIDALPAGGLAVLNADDVWSRALEARAPDGVATITVGFSAAADYRIERVELDAELRPRFELNGQPVEVPLHGEHQAVNAASALAVAHRAFAIRLDIGVESLGAVRPARWRLERHVAGNGVIVLNDAYNANPTSMYAGLHALAQTGTTGHRIAILGDMLELGRYSDEAHADVGRLAAELGIDVVIGVGAGGSQIAGAAKGVHVYTAPDAVGALRIAIDAVEPGDAVLVKASHAVGLETVATGLLDHLGAHRGVPS
jgi:UDP-N-acetylmuramoyl-tripeptide--D-alanyl-D-alanine ligase